jgi:hypothetical protein
VNNGESVSTNIVEFDTTTDDRKRKVEQHKHRLVISN